MSIYRFIDAERATFGTVMLCRHLGVSTSAFYDWQDRPPSRREIDNRSLTKRIHHIHEASRGTYGAPRVTAELRAEGIRVSRKRVARLMRLARLQGVHIRRRRWRKGPVNSDRHRTAWARGHIFSTAPGRTPIRTRRRTDPHRLEPPPA
ncbi:MAG: IS3 family transposase [Actinomycetota bacterium]